MSEKEKVSMQMKQAAQELWPLVKGEKRPCGRAIFDTFEHLRSNLTTAFHKGLVGGYREGGKRSRLWVDKESTLSYVSKYVDVAKKGRVYWPAKNSEPFTGKSMNPRYQEDFPAPVEEEQVVMEGVLGNRYVVVWGDTVELVTSQCGPVPGLYTERCEAAEAALDMLGIQLMSVDG